ncbi:hypothetical protein [Paraflavitalea pollutisoli]|uniref:hypothetical protein n=1 Tax=Paraflavitalea pollutisoli TaxID=3034143 RepID=UPI0023ECC0D6|nr:hypothetical protein [Paraflavitalea sp. H1-2-19X]
MQNDHSNDTPKPVVPDLREVVQNELPILFEFMPETDRTWGIANKLFKAEVEKRYQEAGDSTVEVEANLYYIIRKVQLGDQQAIRMLNFFQRLLEEITMYLPEAERERIRKTIKDILISMDHQYLNFFGEIAVLNNIMKTGLYNLTAVEYKLSDSDNTIDFAFSNKTTGGNLLVEVVNMHPKSNKIENHPEKIATFLTTKFSKKILSKATTEQFYLTPVIWAPVADLKIYSEFLANNNLPVAGLIEPAAYATFVSPEDGAIFIHRFGRLTTLFTDKFGGEYSTNYS